MSEPQTRFHICVPATPTPGVNPMPDYWEIGHFFDFDQTKHLAEQEARRRSTPKPPAQATYTWQKAEDCPERLNLRIAWTEENQEVHSLLAEVFIMSEIPPSS